MRFAPTENHTGGNIYESHATYLTKVRGRMKQAEEEGEISFIAKVRLKDKLGSSTFSMGEEGETPKA